MNPQTCAIVQPSTHCLHLTPYRAPQNSAATRLELPALGRGRKDPRPRAACVHRPPSTLSQRDPLAHQWGANYPCVKGPGGTRCTRQRETRGTGRAPHQIKARAAPFPLAPDAVSRACTARRQLPPPPLTGGTARHGCCRRASTQSPGRATAHRSSSKMAGGI